jgi:hypothetical protein
MALTKEQIQENINSLGEQGATREQIIEYIEFVSPTIDSKTTLFSGKAQAETGNLNNFQKKLRESPQGEEIFQQIQALKEGASKTGKVQDIPKETVGKLITSAQVGAAFTPVGAPTLIGRAALRATPTIVETAGTFGKSLLKGDSLEDARTKALKAGGLSALLDVSLLGAGKVLGSGAAKKFNSAVVDKIKQNPSILKTKKDIDAVAKKAFTSLKNLRRRKGELVGKAKEIATKENKLVDIFPVQIFSNSQKRSAKLIGKKGVEKAEDPFGREAFDVIDTQLSSRFSPTFENIQTKIDNIDDSRKFKKMYKVMQTEGESLTPGEEAALSVRRKLVDVLNKSVEGVLEKGGLKNAKKEFSEIATGLSDPLIKRGSKNRDAMATFLSGVIKKKKLAGFELLSDLEKRTDVKDRFVDDLIGAEVNEGLGNISEFFNLKTPRKILEAGSKLITKPTVSAAIRRGGVEAVTEPGETLETIQGVTAPVVEPVSRSLNEILFKQK